jgi:glycine cleavage system H protein
MICKKLRNGLVMSVLPDHLKYADTHEWVYIDSDGLAVVGITDFAQESLGELMSVTPPELGTDISQGEEVMSVESVKSASDIFAPISGEIVAFNEELEDEPELINDEPYDGGWLFKIQPHDESELDSLMSAEDYQAQIDAE